MIARRVLVAALAATAAGGGAAQEPRRRLVIGWLSAAPHPLIVPFIDQLGVLGYREGTNLEIRRRFAEGQPDRLPALARELETSGVDIVIASGIAAARAVRTATPDQTALFVSADPIRNGLIASHARPGGRMTGISLQMEDIAAKWPEILHQMLPTARRFAILSDRHNAGTSQRDAAFATATALGIAIADVDAGSAADLGPALTAARAAAADGMIVVSSPLFATHAAALVAGAARLRLPAIYEHRQFTEAGGLLSYGPDLATVFRRLAHYVDRLARGADPAELPVEQPTRFELVVNARVARELGLAVPPAILARADEVIE